MVVSDDWLVVVYTDVMTFMPGYHYESVLVEPAFDSTFGRTYAEWSLQRIDVNREVLLGVTALTTAPRGRDTYENPQSRMFNCFNSNIHPSGSASASWNGRGRQMRQGDRVGLLVEGGRVWVFVNGERIGGGAMAEDLPRRLCFLAVLGCFQNCLQLVVGATPPE